MLVEKTQIMDQKAMSRAITRISFEIIERNKGAGNLYIIGIMTRGAELAQRVAKKISELERSSVQVGYLDVTAYRDDKRSGTPGEDKTDLPFPIEGKQIILVDDVIYTGRSSSSPSHRWCLTTAWLCLSRTIWPSMRCCGCPGGRPHPSCAF